MEAQSCRALADAGGAMVQARALAVAVTAAAEAGGVGLRQGWLWKRLGRGEYEATEWPTPSPLLIAKRSGRRVFFLLFFHFSEFRLICITSCTSNISA